MMLSNSTQHVPVSPLRLFVLCCLALLLLLNSTTAASARDSTDSRVDKQYRLAKARYHNFLLPSTSFSRPGWLAVADGFRSLYRYHPELPTGPKCLYMLGSVYYSMYKHSANPLDLGEAITYFEDLFALYPENTLADDGLAMVGSIYAKEKADPKRALLTYAKIIALYPDGDQAGHARAQLRTLRSEPFTDNALSPEPSGQTTVLAKAAPSSPPPPADGICRTAELHPVRHWSSDNYTRVVIETSEPVLFKKYMLDSSGDLPRRLFIDLQNCRINSSLPYSVPIDDGLLKQVRSAQFSPDTVRVVLDTQSNITEHKIFSLEDPFRIVIDVKGSMAKKPKKPPPQAGTPSLVAQLGLGIRRIVLDPGHGGKDPGTIGANGMMEKDITLNVAKKLAVKLREAGFDVILTRDRDVFIPLEERTAIANSREGDLFISIHANASRNKKLSGVETFFLNFSQDPSVIATAARENATSSKNISQMKDIIEKIVQNTKIPESKELAQCIQNSLVRNFSQKHSNVRNLGVKGGPFWVLIGAEVPSVLVEISFLSNPAEEARLITEAYRQLAAQGIYEGIITYKSSLEKGSYQ